MSNKGDRDFFEAIEDFVAGPVAIVGAGVMGAVLGALLGFGAAEMLGWPVLPPVIAGAVVVGAAVAVLRYLVARDEGDA